MTDIVERLRAQYDAWNNPPSPELPDGAGVTLDAAAEIERLRAALREIASMDYFYVCAYPEDPMLKASAALKEDGDD